MRGRGKHSPLVCEAITCSAPVYVLVFTQATCAAAAAAAPAQLLPERRHLSAADLPAPSQLRAPDSRRPPGPAWWNGAGRGG